MQTYVQAAAVNEANRLQEREADIKAKYAAFEAVQAASAKAENERLALQQQQLQAQHRQSLEVANAKKLKSNQLQKPGQRQTRRLLMRLRRSMLKRKGLKLKPLRVHKRKPGKRRFSGNMLYG